MSIIPASRLSASDLALLGNNVLPSRVGGGSASAGGPLPASVLRRRRRRKRLVAALNRSLGAVGEAMRALHRCADAGRAGGRRPDAEDGLPVPACAAALHA